VSAKRTAGTADRILDIAEGLVQVRGFNAFSYADVAKTLGIQKASLHHHFATKASLGLALVERYRSGFLASLDAILNGSDDAGARLERYVELYGSVLRRRRMCLCGMLAADVATLPRPMRASIEGFFAENEAWLTRVLDEGRTGGEVGFEGAAATMAAFFVSSLEGAMLVARASGSRDHFSEVVQRLLATVKPVTATPRRRAR
jgi:TetR/AcrR family transcriptional regulator, transcriptional repressor for nem operon